MERKQVAVKPIIDRDTLIDTRSKLMLYAGRNHLVNGEELGPRIFRFYRPGSTSSDVTDGQYVSLEEYNGLKKQLDDAEERATHLHKLSNTLNQEVNLLRSMVQKLMQENASLRAQVSQVEAGRQDVEKQLIETQSRVNEILMTPKADDSDSDHVPIQNISPHPKPGTSDTFFGGSQQSFSDSETKTQNPYDNINFDTLGYSQPLKTDPISTTTHSTLSSVTSQRSNGQQQSPHESSEDSTAFVTEDETPQSPRTEELPTQESIVKATEQITKKIQELLLAAQGSRHSRYIPCASNISTAVNDMANLFPKHPKAENVRSALRLMITSAARLQVECRSSVLPDRTIDAAMLTQQVIQCAYDIAKAAKQLVMIYNQD